MALAGAALLLAAIGIYGVLSYAVTRRRRELGIRIALGATPASIIRIVSLHGLTLAFVGIAIGMAGALAVTRFLASLLFAVTPQDPFTLALAACVFGVTAAAASYLPARRATQVDPLETLRAE